MIRVRPFFFPGLFCFQEKQAVTLVHLPAPAHNVFFFLPHIWRAMRKERLHYVACESFLKPLVRTRQVHPQCRLDDGVRIGPFCVVGQDVSIGAGWSTLYIYSLF